MTLAANLLKLLVGSSVTGEPKEIFPKSAENRERGPVFEVGGFPREALRISTHVERPTLR